MNELPRKTLCYIVATYGTAVYEDRRRCEALLLDLCPAYRKEIRVLIGALDERVPHALLDSSLNLAVEMLMSQLVQRLVNNLAITEEASEWAVYSWALALNVISGSKVATIFATQPNYSSHIVKTPVQPASPKIPRPSQPISKGTVAPKTNSRVNEISAVFVGAAAVALFLCLISYSPNDWSLNTSSPLTQNWLGSFGAVVADLLFQVIGLTAYFLPILLALISWRFVRAERIAVARGRLVGYIFFVLAVSSLASLLDFRGGITGVFFAQNFSWLVGKIGAGILFVTILAASILSITSFSFASFFGNFQMAWDNFRVHLDEWLVKRNLQRAKKNKSAAVAPKAAKAAPTTSAAEKLTEAREAPAMELFAAPDEISIKPIAREESSEINAEILEEAEEKPIEINQLGQAQNFENYILPVSDLLTAPPPRIVHKDGELLAIAQEITDKAREFSVAGRMTHICQGPVVTTYEFKLDPGVKSSRLTSLTEDLGMSVNAPFLSIQKIPEKNVYGIIIPNNSRETIYLRDVIESKKFRESKSLLTIALGKTIDGLNYVTDLAKMPHLFIVGEVNSGKSILLHTIINSILYKARPDEVKFIMVDPKRLELGLYADIPHLATPIITDPKRAAISLKWAVSEMEKRYKELAGWGVRNIDGFNSEVEKRHQNEQLDDNGEAYKKLPYIVIIIDELADLMMVSGKEVEESITRLAQMARAVGIHLVLATQRPSVDVITGLIKANFPARISFRVSSKVDSRTSIDSNGSESLLGKGDMLFLPPATSQIVRVHGTFVDEKEIHQIVEHVKAQGRPEYDTTITKTEDELTDTGELPGRKDVLFLDALRTVAQSKRASTSLLQRHLRIGYGRAAAILDAMVHEGYIGEMDGSSRARPILQKAYDDLQEAEEGREL